MNDFGELTGAVLDSVEEVITLFVLFLGDDYIRIDRPV